MVSGPDVTDLRKGEAWQWVDKWPRDFSCRNPEIPPGHRAPTVVHHCQAYSVKDSTGAEWHWHKGNMPGDILHCDVPRLKRPPDDLVRSQKDRFNRRTAFLICWLQKRTDDMLTEYKDKFCPPDWPKERSVRMTTSSAGCGANRRNKRGRRCWPNAVVEAPEDPA